MSGDNDRQPLGWAWATVADTGEYVNGVAFKPSDWGGEGHPIIRIQNLTDPAKSFNRTNRKVDAVYEVCDGDILVSWSATLDAFFWRGEDALLNQHIFKVYPEDDLVGKPYLFYLLRHTIDEMRRSEHMHGTTMRHINRRPFLAFPVLIAPKAEQPRIADKLDELLTDLDAGVEALERVRRNLERYRASVLMAAVKGRLTEEWRAEHPDVEPASEFLARILAERRRRWEEAALAKYEAKGKRPPKNWKERYKEPPPLDTTDLPELPEGWVWASVRQLGEAVTGTTPSTSHREYYGGGIPFFKPTDLNAGYFVRSAGDTLAEKGLACSRQIPADTVLVTCIGATIGKTGFARVAGATNQQINAVVTWSDALSKWLFRVFTSPFGQRQIKGNASATTLPILNKGRFETLPVALPPFAEQEELVQRLEELLDLSDARAILDVNEKRGGRLRQSLLKVAFEGRLVPQNPSDEPASALLERIRAAKAVERPAKKKRRKAGAPKKRTAHKRHRR